MKTDQLHDLWTSPDNSRLTTKQFSFRLPVHIAAKIVALCEVYPQKCRTQIVADLLTTAIDELEKRLPECAGEPIADSHCRELEKVLGNEHPDTLYGNVVGTKDQFKTSSK